MSKDCSLPVTPENEQLFAGSMLTLAKMLHEWGIPMERAVKGMRVAYELEGLSVPCTCANDRDIELCKRKDRCAEVMAFVTGQATRSESASTDTARLNFLAEVTNLSVLDEFGAKLTGEQCELIEKTATALSARYEFHRRTSDTPKAFRLAVDEAIKECSK